MSNDGQRFNVLIQNNTFEEPQFRNKLNIDSEICFRNNNANLNGTLINHQFSNKLMELEEHNAHVPQLV